jgi:hypothetical protein
LEKGTDSFGARILKLQPEKFYILHNIQQAKGHPTFFDAWILIKDKDIVNPEQKKKLDALD